MNELIAPGALEVRESKDAFPNFNANFSPNDFKLLAATDNQSASRAADYLPACQIDNTGSISFDAKHGDKPNSLDAKHGNKPNSLDAKSDDKPKVKELCDTTTGGSDGQPAAGGGDSGGANSTDAGAGNSSDTSAGASSPTDASNPFANMQAVEQQFAQDLQNGASIQQLEMDMLNMLDTFIVDMGQEMAAIESSIANSIASNTGITGGDTSGGGTDGTAPNSTDTSTPGTDTTTSGTDTSTPGTDTSTSGTDNTTPGSSSTTPATSDIGVGTGAQGQSNSVGQIVANDGGGNTLSGTAFFVNSDGLMATDDHVVKGSQGPIQVTLANGETFNAQVVKEDPSNDLALLQIQGAGNERFTPVSYSDQSSVTATDTALGYPNAGPLQANSGQYDGTTTFNSLDVTDNTVADNPNRTMLQFSNMMAQEGSSGSPIFNASGQMVGIVDVGDSSGDIYATPSQALQSDIANV